MTIDELRRMCTAAYHHMGRVRQLDAHSEEVTIVGGWTVRGFYRDLGKPGYRGLVIETPSGAQIHPEWLEHWTEPEWCAVSPPKG